MVFTSLILVFVFVALGKKEVKENPFRLTDQQLAYARVGTAFEKENFSDDKKAFKVALKAFEIGVDNFQTFNLPLAVYNLKLAYDFNPNNLLVNYLLARAHMTTASTKLEGEKYILKGLSIDPNNIDLKYMSGMICKSKYLLDSAINIFNSCIEKESTMQSQLGGASASNILKYEKQIRECEYAKSQIANTRKDFRVENMGESVNSEYSEYSSFVNPSGDIMFFTSIRTGAISDKINTYTGLVYEDVYYGIKEEGEVNSSWNIYNTDMPINTMYDDAILNFSFDNKTIYVYRNQVIKSGRTTFIYKQDDEGEWNELSKEESEQLAGRWHITSMSLTAKADTMYFTSDREGGFGKMDIWMSVKQAGEWMEPIVLDSTINTKGNEADVFVDADGSTIYFSSDGHETMGGLDIMYSKKVGTNKWSKPENLGHPVNTVEHDMFYRTIKGGKEAYYSSERLQESFGGFDIFKVIKIETPTQIEQNDPK